MAGGRGTPPDPRGGVRFVVASVLTQVSSFCSYKMSLRFFLTIFLILRQRGGGWVVGGWGEVVVGWGVGGVSLLSHLRVWELLLPVGLNESACDT